MNGIPIVKSKLTMPQHLESIVISDRIKNLISTIYKKIPLSSLLLQDMERPP